MIEWLSIFLSPILGAGAGTMFKKWLSPRPGPPRPVPGGTLGSLSRDVADLQEWREEAQQLLMSQERRLNRLRREARVTRLLVDILLVLLLAGVAAWYYFAQHAV